MSVREWIALQPKGGGVRAYELAKADFLRHFPDASHEVYQQAMTALAQRCGV